MYREVDRMHGRMHTPACDAEDDKQRPERRNNQNLADFGLVSGAAVVPSGKSSVHGGTAAGQCRGDGVSWGMLLGWSAAQCCRRVAQAMHGGSR